MTERVKADLAYVRTEDAPRLPAPRSQVGVQGWLINNLFSTPFYSALTILFGAFLLWIIWGIVDWALFKAVWTGADREACVGEEVGACWPFVADKFAQWIYGFYPIDQRWRPNLVFLLAAVGLVPMLIPSVPYKMWNIVYLLGVFPLIALILLTGGHFGISWGTYGIVIGLMLAVAALLPMISFGIEEGFERNRIGIWLVIVALLPLALKLGIDALVAIFGVLAAISAAVGSGMIAALFSDATVGLLNIENAILSIPGLMTVLRILLVAGGLLSLFAAWRSGSVRLIGGWLGLLLLLLLAMMLLNVDFGLVPVETAQWGGLLVTLVVSVTGMVASLPLGILLALGRRSKMPIVRLFSVVFIEIWRGVPLITVLFMSSVMLPLFLPTGVTFDKLLRALIGVSIFSAAYMAEVVRSGLQAIPKGQYEGAQALGLSYWQMMNKIILPQALKVSIPNIVGNFISLFKDTTLVSIIGIFDLLGIVRAGLKDPNWAAPATVPTGYFALAAMFWIFCFAMSRYSIFIERRLQTGHKR